MEQFFVDYLDRLQALNRDFIAAFADLPAEALDWVPGADMNSFCVLVVHTTGSATPRWMIHRTATATPNFGRRA